MEQPVILCGLGRVGWRVLEFLRAAGLPVVVVDSHCHPNDPRLQEVRAVRGDFREPGVLQEAGIENARGVLIVASDDLVNIAAALTARRLNPHVRIVVRMFNPNLVSRLGSAVTNMYALSVSALTAPMLALSALTGEGLGAFSVDGERRQIVKLVVGAASPLTGRRLADMASEFRVRVLAHECKALSASRMLLEVDGDTRLQIGDQLVVCGEPRDLSLLMPLGDGQEWQSLLPVRFAGRIRRYGRIITRALLEVDFSLKIAGAVLAVVVVTSTLIFHLAVHARLPDGTQRSISLPDGLYRSISIIATGADMKADQYEGWAKVFVSGLRIIGAVLIAAFTAIFTNFLLRARLGGALEIRRIPDSGHILVCGLGNVGFRVVQELYHCGEQVVAIERSRDNPFVNTCRRLGVAVIIGDATILEVLRQARAGSTRAVVAATTNDLVNLEIALLARELEPKLRVVVRLVDPRLAETIRGGADIRLAMSLPALAAPAFVAALYGDKVQSIFRIGEHMVGAVELLVQPNDPCLKGQSIRALSTDYGLLPIALVNQKLLIGDRELDYRLQEKDRLTVIAAFANLERLFRREAAPAQWFVEVTSIPLSAREHIALLIRTENKCGAEEADKVLNALPLRLGGRRTRGQAEDLLVLLQREKAETRLVGE
jgi:Trk K+ transport system NAD-binding subunit